MPSFGRWRSPLRDSSRPCLSHRDPRRALFRRQQPAAANGGRASSTGGRAATGGSAEPAPSPGGAGGAGNDAQAGSAGSDESTAGDGGIEPSPPAIDCGSPPVSQVAFTQEALRIGAIDCAAWQLCHSRTARSTSTRASQPTPPSRTKRRASARPPPGSRPWSAGPEIELFQFGPLSSKNESAGKDVYLGQGLRDAIYGWPSVSRCRVEDQVASQGFASKGMDGVLTSARGLYALEYLPFIRAPTALAPRARRPPRPGQSSAKRSSGHTSSAMRGPRRRRA